MSGTNPLDMSNLFATYFESVHITEKLSTGCFSFNNNSLFGTLNDLKISIKDMILTLRKVNGSNTVTCDNFSMDHSVRYRPDCMHRPLGSP